jgi:hypothetical protein
VLNPADRVGPETDPVFVLCMGRSGSTLLRFLLDAHPDLACPPETSLPALCGQLAVVWSLIEGAPLSANRGDAPPQVPDTAIAGIRRMVDEMTNGYLARRGKKRFCDKSLGSARFAELLMRIYPAARFVSLYRHPMDMIRSGLDACPWGLNGYGFEQYIGSSPGNAVLALARYWLDNAMPIAAFEEENPDWSFRIRYEDLVAAPEQIAQDLFAFLGVAPVPGISERCFTGDRERHGPADYKIWATSSITGDSVGKGESVPVGLIPPPITHAINELADKLGYLHIDEDWGTPGRPADPRLPETIRLDTTPTATATSHVPHAVGLRAADAHWLEERLRAGIGRMDERFLGRWQAHAKEKLLVVVRSGREELHWCVDLAARTIVTEGAESDDVEWNMVGSPAAWQAVLSGQVNMQVALRRCDLRYCSNDEDAPFTPETRVAMLTDLLGMSPWQGSDGL